MPHRWTVAVGMLLLLVLPLFSGCVQDDPMGPPPQETRDSAGTGATAGAGAPGPSAPSSAYEVESPDPSGGLHRARAYPLMLASNPPRPPVTITEEGVFEPAECTPRGNLDPTSSGYRGYDLGEALEVQDVFSYKIELRFTNTDASWGDIHLSYRIGSRYEGWFDPVGDARGEIVQNFTGQGYRIGTDQPAWAAVSCWQGFVTEPLAYTLTVTFTFAENAVPAEVPVQVNVPANATRLFVSGVPLGGSESVLSHYRVFGPNDEMLCECALNSNEATDTFPLPGPGEYVVLVDHTAGGFVALALDAASPDPLVPLDTEWTVHPILRSDGERLDETVEIDLPVVPLDMSMWWASPAGAPADAGGGKQLRVHVVNPRGDVYVEAHAAFTMYWTGSPRHNGGPNFWLGLPLPGNWEEFEDHHAFDKGPHQVHVQAEWFRGQINLFTLTYIRA